MKKSRRHSRKLSICRSSSFPSHCVYRHIPVHSHFAYRLWTLFKHTLCMFCSNISFPFPLCVCVPSVQNLFHRYCSSFFCIGLSSSFATFAIIGGALSIRYQFVHEWYNSIIVQREREWELERELNANVHRKHFVAFYCLCYYCLRIISISISILLNCVQ